MYDRKLIFKGYATNNLDEAETKFRLQTGERVEAFYVRPGWYVYGSKQLRDKMLVSRFAPYAGIYIPLDLTLDELKAIEAERTENTTHAMPKNGRNKVELEPDYLDGYERHCTYCGRLYVTDPLEIVMHCGAPACIEKHKQYERHVNEIREKQIEQRKAAQKKRKPKEITEVATPEFSLDDETKRTLRGWVYLIEAENGLWKIGRANDISNRFGNIAAMSPVQIYLRHTIESMNYVVAEEWMHNQFNKQRHHGEWFSLSPEDVDWIMSIEDWGLDQA